MDKVDAAAGQISNVFSDWLKAEVASSSIERNKVLDKYEDAVEGLRGGWQHPKNFSARKIESHIDRLGPWFEAFSFEPNDDYQAARLIFAGLMQISGSYRMQCYVEAQDSQDYLKRRDKAVGIDLQQPISTRLHTHLPSTGNFANAHISIDKLNERRQETERMGMLAVRSVCARAYIGYDLKHGDSRAAREMIRDQYNWVTFAADCLTYIAKTRKGNLAEVPFLEPRSITDQSGKTYYPLASPINWAEILAA